MLEVIHPDLGIRIPLDKLLPRNKELCYNSPGMRKKDKERKKKERIGAGTLTGELHMARNGAGYLIHPETDAAIWIEAKDLSTALPGDMVTIRLGRDGTDGSAAWAV